MGNNFNFKEEKKPYYDSGSLDHSVTMLNPQNLP